MEQKGLETWQLNYLKRLPVSEDFIKQILREEYNVDFDGNPLPQRQFVTISRKKKRQSEQECKENQTSKNAIIGEETCLSMEQDQ